MLEHCLDTNAIGPPACDECIIEHCQLTNDALFQFNDVGNFGNYKANNKEWKNECEIRKFAAICLSTATSISYVRLVPNLFIYFPRGSAAPELRYGGKFVYVNDPNLVVS